MRYRKSKKLAALLFTALFLLTKISFASDIEDYLDEFLFTELQISAVTTDMYMYLGWFPDEKEGMKEASEEAIKDLDEIQYLLANLFLPKELLELRQSNLRALEKLRDIYNGIESKEKEGIKREFDEFSQLYLQFQEKIKSTLKQFRKFQELPKDFNPIDEEVKNIENEMDKNIYLSSIELIKDKKYREAYENLDRLKDKYRSSIFEDCILLKMSDCLLMADSDLETGEDKLEGKMNALEMLSQILDNKRYSPILFEAFYKWRTTEQYYNHGMSNMSGIPNKKYNEKRWGILQVIKRYLKNKPDDIWAKKQVDLLLSLDNITRGGPMGNHNIEHWGSLYVDLSKFKSEEKKE